VDAHGLLGHDDEFRLWRTGAEHVAGNARFRHPASYAAFVDARVAVHTGQTDTVDVLTERALPTPAPGLAPRVRPRRRSGAGCRE
jgi:hypothetical protein